MDATSLILLFSGLPMFVFFYWLYEEEKRKLRLERLEVERWQEEQQEKLRERREEIQRKLNEADKKGQKEIEVEKKNYLIIPQQITISVPKVPEVNQPYRQASKDFVIEKLTEENERLKKKVKEKENTEEESSSSPSFPASVDSFISDTMRDLMDSSSSSSSSYSTSTDDSGSSSSSSSSSSWDSDSSSSSSSSSDYSGGGGDFGGGGSSSDW